MQLIEKVIVAKLIKEMDAAGFVPVRYFDGEAYQRVQYEAPSLEERTASAIDCIDSVDEGTLHFAPKTDVKAWGRLGVLLILGNGEDIISDYHCARHTPAFAPAIEKVSAWIESGKARAVVVRLGKVLDKLDAERGEQ